MAKVSKIQEDIASYLRLCGSEHQQACHHNPYSCSLGMMDAMGRELRARVRTSNLEA